MEPSPPESVEPTNGSDDSQVRIAPAHYRILAGLTDVGLAFLAVRFFFYPLLIPENWDRAGGNPLLDSLPSYLAGFAAFLLKDSLGAASPGKRLFSLRTSLVQSGYPRPSFWRLPSRNLFLILLPLELILLVVDKHYRRMGDKFLGTMVIQELKPFKVRYLTIRLLAVLFVFASVWSAHQISVPHVLRKSEFYRFALKRAESDPVLRELLGQDFAPESGFEYGVSGEYHTFDFTFTNRNKDVLYSITVLFQENEYSFYKKEVRVLSR